MSDEKSKQLEKADRYTVLTVSPEKMVETIAACRQLGLFWFAITDIVRFSKCVSFYVFFDYAGMRNYLRGRYDREFDEED